jgi:preprotein translocase subunit SecY
MQEAAARSESARSISWRPLVVVLLALAAYTLGGWIPLPGLDPAAVEAQTVASPGLQSRLSIMALGILPLFGMMILFEIAKLIVPPLASWQARSPRAAGWIAFVIGALALGTAATQGFGVTEALSVMGLQSPETPMFRLVAVASLIGGVAVAIFLADRIRLPDLALAGLWALFALPSIPSLVRSLFGVVDYARVGAVDAGSVGIAFALLLAVVVAIVFLANALRDRVVDAGGAPIAWSPLLLWPPVVAGHLAGLVAGLVQVFVLEPGFETIGGGTTTSLETFRWVYVAGVVVLVPVVIVVYARMIARLHPASAQWTGKRAVLTGLALVQIAVMVGVEFQPWPILPIGGAALVALVVVLWALVCAMRDPRTA